MKIDYEYFVHATNEYGYSTVEYVHPDLGSITRYMILPYDSPEMMHRKIVENFPIDLFRGEWLRQREIPIPEGLHGSFSVDFDDYFYDFINEATGG